MTSVVDRTPEQLDRVGLIAGILAYLSWGVFPLYFHSLLGTSPVEVVCHRVVWSLLVVSIPLARRGDFGWIREVISNRLMLRNCAAAALLIATNWLLYIWAATHGRVIEGALGYFINPLVVILIGVAVLSERLRRLQWIAVGLAGLAVVVLTIEVGSLPWVSLVLSFTFAGYGFLKRQIELPPLRSLAVETALMAPLALVGLIILAATGSARFGTNGLGGGLWLALSGPVTAVPLVLFATAARRLPFTVIGMLQFLTPVLQFLCGVLVLHEAMSTGRWIGFGIVWISLMVLTFDAVRHRRV